VAGVPQLINARDELEVYRLQVALNDHVEPPEKHRGEAESIHIAEKIGGSLLTDDSGAYDFAVRRGRIATGRVIDSVQVLRNAVAMTYITKEEAKAIFDTVVTTLRDFRRCHPTNPTAEYFDI
jgi:predicted nucleic acid-binding protein